MTFLVDRYACVGNISQYGYKHTTSRVQACVGNISHYGYKHTTSRVQACSMS